MFEIILGICFGIALALYFTNEFFRNKADDLFVYVLNLFKKGAKKITPTPPPV